ncbi:MAG: hypothetical protein ABI868_12145 [Acidobacteriota bacterium]
MGKINLGRVLLGGLLAGVVGNIGETILNVAVAGTAMESALAARNLPPVAGPAIGGFVVITFLVGILTVWLYAAIRPRFGPGPGTAVIAALVVWFFAYLHQSVAMGLMGFLPASVTVLGTVWGLVEIVAAALAGAWVYKE